MTRNPVNNVSPEATLYNDFIRCVRDQRLWQFVTFITNQRKFFVEKNGAYIKLMGIKKPVPREGRVISAQVVKLVNTGDCHSPGLCSKSYTPYGFEPRLGHQRLKQLSENNDSLSMVLSDTPEMVEAFAEMATETTPPFRAPAQHHTGACFRGSGSGGTTAIPGLTRNPVNNVSPEATLYNDFIRCVRDQRLWQFVTFITNQRKFFVEKNGAYIKLMGIKKPVPREGRVISAQVVKLVNTGDSHSPGLCSKTYMPYGFETRLGHQRLNQLSEINDSLSMVLSDTPEMVGAFAEMATETTPPFRAPAQHHTGACFRGSGSGGTTAIPSLTRNPVNNVSPKATLYNDFIQRVRDCGNL